VVGMVFDDIIVDGVPVRAALGARFNVNVRHILLSLDYLLLLGDKNNTNPKPPVAPLKPVAP